jgi:hypothetical protein
MRYFGDVKQGHLPRKLCVVYSSKGSNDEILRFVHRDLLDALH